MFEFFRVWLVVLGAGMAIGGSLLAILGGTRVFAFMNRLMDPPLFAAVPTADVRRYQAWLYGVLGGTLAGWGLTVAVVVAAGFEDRDAWAWFALLAGSILWFVLDTGQSLRFRVWANVALNVALLVALLVPLAFTFGEMR